MRVGLQPIGLGLLLLAVLGLSSTEAFAKPGLQVAWKEGRVELSGSSGWRPVQVGSRVAAGTKIRTGPKARVELEAPDGSMVRLGPNSKLGIDEATAAKNSRKVGLRLWAGRVWASVTKALTGSESRFEVRTSNAVAGVRGTSFTVLAQDDLSALVRVYSGTVGVRGRGKKGQKARRQVAGPQQVSLAEWSEVIATAMTEVKISAVGEIRPAEAFDDTGDGLEWAQWNQARDDARR